MRPIEGEQVIHEMRPRGTLLVVWFFAKALPIGFLGMAPYAWFDVPASRSFGPPVPSATTLAITATCVIAVLVYCVYLRRTYVYYVTNQRCVFHGGILRRVERSVPYHKITDVEMSQNIVERILGMSRLNIFTPGTASSYGSYPGGGQRAEISFVALRDSETPAHTINQILRQYRATGE